MFQESRAAELRALSSRDVDKRRLKGAHNGVQGKLLVGLPKDIPLFTEPLIPDDIVSLTEDGASLLTYNILNNLADTLLSIAIKRQALVVALPS